MWPTAAASTSPGWVVGAHRDVAPGGGVARAPALGVLAHERADVAPRRRPLVVAGEREHALDRRLEAVEGAQALVEHDGAVRARRVELGLDRHPHRRDRRAQLVRHVRRERALAAQQLADAVAGVVEGGAELVELADARWRPAAAGVVPADASRPLAEPLDRPAEAAGEQHADHAGDGDDRDPGGAEQQQGVADAGVALAVRGCTRTTTGVPAVGVHGDGGDEVAVDVALRRPSSSTRATTGSASSGPLPDRSRPLPS